MVRADAEYWIVNAAVSASVLLAFAGIFVLQATGLDALTPYVDPIVVITIVMISISVPVRMAYRALMALLNRAPTNEVIKQVTDIVDQSLHTLPVQERFVRVTQPGRQRMVLVHVVLPADYQPVALSELDAIREQTTQALCVAHMVTLVDILFTGDRQWGAPLSAGGQGGTTTE